ncbi:Rv3235 family protein [Curtobacterium sp. ISL-83]|uniref:Rv3235 family protein n=1 Tax=Curtobacterium sp. ISL-83 TaxID=2819145 RepID=UPI001BEB62AA|nr:Rv3235 family protein [Curtobacterium sp. ISL-83]MBT2503119.1 3-hydroxyacyl-CoA dehydrogenase [Curtobacterium sp. ISL-83]
MADEARRHDEVATRTAAGTPAATGTPAADGTRAAGGTPAGGTPLVEGTLAVGTPSTEPVPTALEALTGPPDPAETARALGLCVAEVLTGAREVDSISRWITDEVHRHLLQRAAFAARARSIGQRSRARPVLSVGSVVVSRPAPGVAEAAVVVHTRSHARAVALRLEERNGRWRATAVVML